MMENVKKSKLTGKIVNINWKICKIYIHNNLTQFNKNLFFKARTFARENRYYFVWFKGTKVFGIYCC